MVINCNPYNDKSSQGINSAANSSFTLFDPKISDHILTGKDAAGWALQGTYTLPSDIDFYNKCIEEQEASTSDIIGLIGEEIVQPTFNSNTEDGITISDSLDGTTDLQKIMNGSANYVKVGLWADYWINIDYDKKTKISSYVINSNNSSGVGYPSAWTLQGSNDGNNWDILDTQEGQTFATNQAKEFFIDTKKGYKQYRLVFSDGIEASGDGFIKQVIFKVYEWWSFSGYINPNGHIFYDISEKHLVDKIYNLTGIAWFYGVDKENQRIFLPRNDYFLQMTGNINEVGKFIKAGLPQHTHDMHFSSSGAQGMAGGGAAKDCIPSNPPGKIFRITSGASDSTYGKSNTVQPKSTKMLLYICVGNTIADTAKIDAQKLAGEVRNFETLKADKTQLDGPWGPSNDFSMSDIALPVLNETTPLYFDLSDVLPTDNNEYEIRFTVEIQTAAKQNAFTNLCIYGFNNYHKGKLQLAISTPANIAVSIMQSGTAVIGTDRRLEIDYRNVTAAGKILNFWLNSIRRKGIV